MNTNILTAIKAAYAAGLADGARQADVISKLAAEHDTTFPASNGSLKVWLGKTNTGKIQRSTKAADAPKDIKPAKIERGVRAQSGTKDKGVKEGIQQLLSNSTEGLGSAAIAETLNFKANSVNGTLMALKKKGLVKNENKLWSLAATPVSNGVSEPTDIGA